MGITRDDPTRSAFAEFTWRRGHECSVDTRIFIARLLFCGTAPKCGAAFGARTNDPGRNPEQREAPHLCTRAAGTDGCKTAQASFITQGRPFGTLPR